MSPFSKCSERRFVVDVMLGRLAKWLRVLGFDARIMHLPEKRQLDAAIAGGFIPVTRREKFRSSEGVVFITSNHHFQQLKELISAIHLDCGCLRLFSRCVVCNEELESISRAAAQGAVPDFIFETATDFTKCPQCGRIYWPGSHKGRMLEKLASIMEGDRQDEEGENGRK